MAGHPRTREPLLGSDVQTADPETPLGQDPQEWRTDVALRDGPVGDAGDNPDQGSIPALDALLRESRRVRIAGSPWRRWSCTRPKRNRGSCPDVSRLDCSSSPP